VVACGAHCFCRRPQRDHRCRRQPTHARCRRRRRHRHCCRTKIDRPSSALVCPRVCDAQKNQNTRSLDVTSRTCSAVMHDDQQAASAVTRHVHAYGSESRLLFVVAPTVLLTRARGLPRDGFTGWSPLMSLAADGDACTEDSDTTALRHARASMPQVNTKHITHRFLAGVGAACCCCCFLFDNSSLAGSN
jgi:hypothetical protein